MDVVILFLILVSEMAMTELGLNDILKTMLSRLQTEWPCSLYLYNLLDKRNINLKKYQPI